MPARKTTKKAVASETEAAPAPVKKKAASSKKVEATHVLIGASHRCLNGQMIRTGQAFTPDEVELESFGDKFRPIEVYRSEVGEPSVPDPADRIVTNNPGRS